jgi:hypothetical protein
LHAFNDNRAGIRWLRQIGSVCLKKWNRLMLILALEKNSRLQNRRGELIILAQ